MGRTVGGWKTYLGWGCLVLASLSGGAARAHDGIIQIVGAITTPSCAMTPPALLQLQQQSGLISQSDCRASALHPTSAAIAMASIERSTIEPSQAHGSVKALLTVSYR